LTATPRSFDRAWASLLYNEELGRLLFRFKYGQKTALRHFFSEAMMSFIATYHLPIEQIDLIVPVPLHPSRQRDRGFNQSELLAERLADNFQISLSRNNLKRVRPTRFQARVSQKERWTNVEGAFRIKSPIEFAEKNVLLIDDLLTTGATSSEAARVIKAAGGQQVFVLTLAIATEKHSDLLK